MRGTRAYFRICLLPLMFVSLVFSYAVIDKKWHFPWTLAICLFSPFTWLEMIGGRYGPLRVLRPGRDVKKHCLCMSGILSKTKKRNRNHLLCIFFNPFSEDHIFFKIIVYVVIFVVFSYSCQHLLILSPERIPYPENISQKNVS